MFDYSISLTLINFACLSSPFPPPPFPLFLPLLYPPIYRSTYLATPRVDSEQACLEGGSHGPFIIDYESRLLRVPHHPPRHEKVQLLSMEHCTCYRYLYDSIRLIYDHSCDYIVFYSSYSPTVYASLLSTILSSPLPFFPPPSLLQASSLVSASYPLQSIQ